MRKRLEHAVRRLVPREMAYRLRLGRPIGREIVIVIEAQIARAIRAIGDRDLPAAERVHRGRTSCKRIRAALRLIRAAEPRLWRRENAWFRDAARELAPLRDATVLATTLAAVLRSMGVRTDRGGGGELCRAALAQRRTALRDLAPDKEIAARFTARMRAAARRFSALKLKIDTTTVVARGLGETYRRARRAWRSAETVRSVEAFHELRKCAKDHGYHCRLLRGAWPAVMREWQRELGVLGDTLGEEHDLAVLDRWLRDNAPPRSGANVLTRLRREIRRRRGELRKRGLLAGARLCAEKPQALSRRLLRWWRAAHELVASDDERRQP